MITINGYGASGIASEKQVTLQFKPELSEQDYWQTTYSFNVDLSTHDFDEYVITLELPAEKIWSITPDRKLIEIETRFRTPFVVGRFFIVKNQQGIFKIDLPWAMQIDITKRADKVEVKTWLRDKLSCGFRLWGADKIIAPKEKHTLQVLQSRLNDVSECVWLEPYHKGERAVICLTDHADFDSVEKVELLTELFIQHDLKITKSIFPHSDPNQNKNEPGLDNLRYRKLIEKLYAHGSEIAYHGLSPRMNAPSIDECRRRAEAMKSFNVTTWIDHGTGPYLFSRKETLDNGTRLTGFLNDYGIKNYWSYNDIWNNPLHDLACERSRGNFDIVKDLAHSLPLLKSISPLKMAYIFSHSFNNFFGDGSIKKLRESPLNLNTWSSIFNQRHDLFRLKKQPQLLYGRDGTCISLNLDKPWIFDTVLLNHLRFQLRPSLIDRLSSEAGFLIAHCYFCAQLSHISDNCFVNKRNMQMIIPKFATAVEHIAKRQRERDIAVLPFQQLREVLCAFFTTTLVRNQDGWQVHKYKPGKTVIAGSSMFISSSSLNDSEQWSKSGVRYLALPNKNTQDIKFAAAACV